MRQPIPCVANPFRRHARVRASSDRENGRVHGITSRRRGRMNYSPIETTEPILVLGSKLFWRHRRAAAAICCVTLVASIFYALLQAPTYTADAQIVPTLRRTENGPRGDTIA